MARQPIFDRGLKVFGYELLFRSGLANFFTHTDGDMATSRVIADSFLLFGLEELTGGAKAFINFTRNLLLQDYALVLPTQVSVVEVLETVEPDPEVLAACRRLKDRGYTLALDDFVFQEKYRPLIELADIIKVDFLSSSPEEIETLARNFRSSGHRLLAEKVESHQDFQKALDFGYAYFQGYFFSRPAIVSRKDLPAFKIHHLRLIQELNAPEMDFNGLTRLVESEVSLSYKLLKYINSAAFGLRAKVASIKQALTLLGEIEVRRWASLITLTEMASDRPAELVVTSLTRARFCELLAPPAGLAERKSDLFLMGLFSQLDAIVGRPLKELLDQVPVADEVKAALLGRANRLRPFLDLFEALDQARWSALSKLAKKTKIKEEVVAQTYLDAIMWSQGVFQA
ncbi:MAG: HDOD domain-containing protein [Thermodesulfobacteriota bacterium]